MVVVDEAYAEFARPGAPSALTLLPGHPRLVVTRTMCKAFAMRRRCGSATWPRDPAVVDAVQLVRLPYHLSALTQAAARVALAHAPELLATVDAIKAERDRIVAALRGARADRGAERRELRAVRPVRRRSARPGRHYLDRGVLVRDVGHRPAGCGSPPARRPRDRRRSCGRARAEAEHAGASSDGPVSRTGRVERVTTESSVLVELDLDGSGRTDVAPGRRSTTTCWPSSASTAAST